MTSSLAPVLILGATSDIGRAVARAFAAHGHPLILAARRPQLLAPDAADLRLRHGVEVHTCAFDALDVADHRAFVERLPVAPEIAVCLVGVLDDQQACQGDDERAVAVMRSNYEGPALVLSALAESFERRGRGCLIGVSSVAGERGRARNYIYGSAKAGFTAFLSGLRNRLASGPIRVVTVKPGFVDTRMTAGMTLPPLLTASPDEVARAIHAAYRSRRDVVYVRPVWWLIMALIRIIPERVFKRLDL